MNEHHNIDERLSERGQEAVRQLISELPSDTPSLAWRSELNEKLFVLAAPKKRSWFATLVGPIAGMAAAGALGLFLFTQTPNVSHEGSLEAKMLEHYQAQGAVADLGGFAVANSAEPRGTVVDPEAIEVDLESL